MRNVTRRQFLAGGLGVVGAVGATGIIGQALGLLSREDLIPGEAPSVTLTPEAWTTTDEHLSFVALGDNGSGGRQAMAVAREMAANYQHDAYGLVALLGDICYYGPIKDRFDDVFILPMTPLIDAGVEFELAVGNHDGGLNYGDESLGEIEDTLEALGTPDLFYKSTHGPADFFYLDSSAPGVLGSRGKQQLEWLDDTLASATSQWKIVAMHHPVYSCGRHGSTPRLREKLEPILVRHKVDLVLSGHDHNYERTVPIDGITYIVSGGGCKTTSVNPKRFTARAAESLEFVRFDIGGDSLVGRAITPTGATLDLFELQAREGR